MSVRYRKACGLVFCAVLAATVPHAAAAQKGKDKQQSSVQGSTRPGTRVAVEVFIGGDRDTIRGYYAEHPGNLPPGLAKRGGDLPPGLEKQLRRKGHLPPGLEKTLVPFPPELEMRLAPLRPELRRGIIHGRAVIINPRTSVILDVLYLP